MAKAREFKCKECGKTFGDFKSLGGHVVQKHRRPDTQQPAQGIPGTGTIQAGGEPTQPRPSQEGEPDKAESIRKLLKKGFSPRQIKGQFGYARTTVDERSGG